MLSLFTALNQSRNVTFGRFVWYETCDLGIFLTFELLVIT